MEPEEVTVFCITTNLSGSGSSVVGVRCTFVGVFCVVKEVVGLFDAEGGIEDLFTVVCVG